MRRSLPGPIILLILAACADAPGPPRAADRAAVRDSSGITIVANDAPGNGPRWSVSAEPIVVFGADSGGDAGDVVGLARLPGGRLVAGDALGRRVRVFGADGRTLMATGREGSGPGEFAALRWVAAIGDTLLAYDRRLRRLTRFDADGRVLATAVVAPVGERTFAEPVGRAGSGFVGTSVTLTRMPEDGRSRDTLTIVRFDSALRVIDTLAAVPGDEVFLAGSGGEGLGRMFQVVPMPFGRSMWIAAGGDRVFVGDNDRYEIAEYAGGRMLRSIRLAIAPGPVTDAMIAARRAASLERAADSTAQQLAQAVFASAALPRTLPAWADFLVDDAGFLWVRASAVHDGDSTRYDVFATDGVWAAAVSLPPRFRALLVSGRSVVGVAHDADDVQQLREYRLDR